MRRRRQLVCRLLSLIWIPLIPSFSAIPQISQASKSVALSRIVRLEPGMLEKMTLTRRDPELPPIPAELEVPATAVLELVVDKTGSVQNARPVNVHARLQEAAIRAAKEWKFRPYLENGKPAIVLGIITIHFKIGIPAPEQAEVRKARTEVEGDATNPNKLVSFARLLQAAGRYEEAIAGLNRAISLQPDLLEAHLLLADLYGRIGEYENQVEQYEYYLELKPDSPDVLDLLGRIYMERKEYENAGETFGRLLKLRPEDATVLEQIGLAYTEQNELEKAMRTYRKAIAIAPDSAMLHTRLAFELIRIREFNEAESELSRALTLDPHLAVAYRHMAGVYWYANRTEEGLAMALMAIKNAPPDLKDLDRDYLGLGSYYGRMKQFSDAEAACSQAIEINPESSEAYCMLGGIEAQQGKNESALEIFAKGLRVNDDSACLNSGLGLLLSQMNRMEEAEVRLRKAQTLMPENPQTSTSLAFFLTKKGDYAEALSVLEAAVKRMPGDHRLYLYMADVLSRSGRAKEAEQALRDSLRFEPQNPLALNNLGYSLIDQDRDLEEAAEMIGKAVAADPENAAYLDSYGWAHFKLGKLDQAEKYLLSSLKIKSEEPIVLEHLGDVYRKQEKTDLANEQWRQALAITRQDDQKRRLKQKLGISDE